MSTEDTFLIEIEYKGNKLQFNGELIAVGYIHKIICDINGKEVSFEPDEERIYRAIVPAQFIPLLSQTDMEIIPLILAKLQTLL